MPKSKRQKVISLTKTVKKGKEYKQARFQKIQDACLNHRYTYVFVPHNMRNKEFKHLHECLSENSLICMGKNKLMMKAFTVLNKEALTKLTHQLHGFVGILFSNEHPDTLASQLANLGGQVYARSGNIASKTIHVPAGLLQRHGESIPGSLEPTLRQLGLPTSLQKGLVVLNSPYTICKEGDVLSPNQAHLLKHFYIQLSEFRVELKCYYDSELDEFHEL